MTRAHNSLRVSCRRLAAALSVLLLAGSALAGEPKADGAQVAFEEGMALMDQGDYERACPLLEQSVKLDPAMAATFRWAECLEQLGDLATAMRRFIAVSKAARAAGMKDREQAARARAAALEPRVARLSFVVPAEVAALGRARVVLDGKLVPKEQWGEALPVDPGSHRVEVSAVGKAPLATVIEVIGEGTTTKVEIPPLEEEGTTTSPAEDGATNGQLIAGIVLAGVGVAAMGAGGVVALVAKARYDESDLFCVDDRCEPKGLDLRQGAISQADAASVTIAVGAAALIGGGILWLTAPDGGPSAEGSGRGAWAVGVAPTGLLLRGRW